MIISPFHIVHTATSGNPWSRKKVGLPSGPQEDGLPLDPQEAFLVHVPGASWRFTLDLQLDS